MKTFQLAYLYTSRHIWVQTLSQVPDQVIDSHFMYQVRSKASTQVYYQVRYQVLEHVVGQVNENV